MVVDRARIEEALPGYELGAALGRGGVIAGRHRGSGRAVAIRVSNRAGADDRTLRVLADLEHPHIVRLHEYVVHDGLLLLVTELLPGGSLADRLPERVTPEYACGLGLAVADALDTAHRRRVPHGDVRPGNLLFDADGAVKVAGLGGSTLAPGADRYALSVVLYRLLAGRPLDRPPSAMAGVDGRVAAVVCRGLTHDVDARQPTVRSYALELAAAAAGAYGGDWLARAGLPVRVDEELLAAARSGVAQRDETPDWPWGPPPRRLDEALPPAARPPCPRPRPRAAPPPGAGRAWSGVAASGAAWPAAAGGGPAGPDVAESGPVEPSAAGPAWGRAGPAWGRVGAARGRAGRVGSRPAGGTAAIRPMAGAGGDVKLAGGPAWRARGWRRRTTGVGAALLGAALAAIVVGLGVSTFATGPPVVPGPGGVAAAGTALYVSDPARSQVRRYDSLAVNGTGRRSGTVVAGSGRDGYSGDGGPATDAALSEPGSLAADGNGNLYIADVGNRRIRKVSADGRITTVVGGGSHPLTGRLRGTHVHLSVPFSIAVSSQGTLWIAEQQRNRVSRLKPDGTVEPYVGTGRPGFGGDGLYASWALLDAPTAVALNSSGDRLYIADEGNRRIREVRIGSGFIRTIAGDGTPGPFRNSVQATTVGLSSVDTLTATADGTLYLGGGDTRLIDPDGFVQPVASIRTISLALTARGTLYLVAEQETASGDRVHRLYRRTDTGRLVRLPW